MARIAPSLAVALALVAVGAAPAQGQHFPPDAEIEALLQQRVDEGRAVGIVVGLMEADGSTRVLAAGEAGPGARPLSEHSVFEIGSITKAFTGILLAEMVARGEVSLDDPVQRYLPDGVTMPTRAGREITLEDLATHRSALPRLPSNMAPADVTNPYADYTVEMMYAFLNDHELRRDIGAEAEYSNLGVGLLGHALARAAGTDYESLVGARILEPLGMEASAITLSGRIEAAMAVGHDQRSNPTPLWDVPALAGAGALRSSMTDMLTFLAANVGEPTTELERAMRAAHEVREEFAPGMDIGLNWITRDTDGDHVVWHNGGTGGFRTFLGFDPVRRVGAVVLTNSAHGADDIGFHLIDPELPLTPAPEPAPERVAIDVDPRVLEAYAGVYQLAPSFTITVTVEDGALHVQATGQPRFPIFAESEDFFFLRVVDAQVTFTRTDGVVTGLVLHQGGADQPARKIR